MRQHIIAAAILASVSTFSSAQVNRGNGNGVGGTNAGADSHGGSPAATDGGAGAAHAGPHASRAKSTTSKKSTTAAKPGARGAHANSTGTHTAGTSLGTETSGQTKR
jgi:hypothetical protein